MSKYRTLDNFLKLERGLPTENVLFRGIRIWGYLRNYYAEKFLLSKERSNRPSQSLALKGISNIMMGWTYWFRKYDYIAIVSSNQRKLVEGVYEHPLDQLPAKYSHHTLFIELNNSSPNKSDSYPKDHKVVSRFVLAFFELILVRLLPKRRYIEAVECLKEIEHRLGVTLDRLYLLKRFDASFIVMRMLLRIYKPKGLLCMVSYPIAGYIMAAKVEGVLVVEMQHGYIGQSHRAYNLPKPYGSEIYPDYFLSWGKYEVDFFTCGKGHFINSNKVLPVGNYFLENYLSKKTSLAETYGMELKGYEVVVAISMQDPLEKEIMAMVTESALLDSNIAYLLLPRSKDAVYYQNNYRLSSNIIQISGINTYEGMLLSHVHSTMWSTTAFEGLAMGLPNVLINTGGMSNDIYGHILTQDQATYYAETAEEYVVMIRTASKIEPHEVKKLSEYYFKEDFNSSIDETIVSIFG